jgi:hypothetical protein
MPVRIVSTLLVALALAIASPRPAGAASGISLSDPVSYENLSVYFVRGPSSKAPAPLTLQEASAKGLVRIREMSTGSPMLDNLSDKPVFVPFGTLLTGGLQDQVVARSLFVGARRNRHCAFGVLRRARTLGQKARRRRGRVHHSRCVAAIARCKACPLVRRVAESRHRVRAPNRRVADGRVHEGKLCRAAKRTDPVSPLGDEPAARTRASGGVAAPSALRRGATIEFTRTQGCGRGRVCGQREAEQC